MVSLEEKFGLLDKNENQILPLEYDESISFIDGLAIIKKNDKYGFIDITGKKITPIIYSDVRVFFRKLSCRKTNRF